MKQPNGIVIHTRQQPNGKKWRCNATILGNDVSFEDFTPETARNQMRAYLQKVSVDPETVKWVEPQFYKLSISDHLLK